MKFFIVLALLVAAAAAAPASVTNVKDEQVLRYEFNNIGVGEYNYGFETSGGKSVQEQGVLKNVGSENEALEVRGSYSYVDNDGVKYTVDYVANENGFQPTGVHLPVA